MTMTKEQCRDRLINWMKEEDCELVSEYMGGKKLVYYLYEGLEYRVTPDGWKRGCRPHKSKQFFRTQNHVKELFRREGCELISEYLSTQIKLEYKYKNVFAYVTLHNWIEYNMRPHLWKKQP